VRGLMAAGVAMLGGAVLAGVTAFGVVNTVGGTATQSERDVVDYGTVVTD
jgi:hypothetical protein